MFTGLGQVVFISVFMISCAGAFVAVGRNHHRLAPDIQSYIEQHQVKHVHN